LVWALMLKRSPSQANYRSQSALIGLLSGGINQLRG
jgi:hypothetical protein